MNKRKYLFILLSEKNRERYVKKNQIKSSYYLRCELIQSHWYLCESLREFFFFQSFKNVKNENTVKQRGVRVVWI